MSILVHSGDIGDVVLVCSIIVLDQLKCMTPVAQNELDTDLFVDI